MLQYCNPTSCRSHKRTIQQPHQTTQKYHAMAAAACEITWLRQLLQQIKFGDVQDAGLICDNEAAIHIASNPVFHERTKHRDWLSLCAREGTFSRNHHWFCQLQRPTSRHAHKILALELTIFVTSLDHMTSMLQLEGECKYTIFIWFGCVAKIRDFSIIIHYLVSLIMYHCIL